MKALVYRLQGFNVKDAQALCDELEAELGLSLCVRDPSAPNDVHGYLNTGSDGYVEIFLYEGPDVAVIAAMHPSKKAHDRIHKVHPITLEMADAASRRTLTKHGPVEKIA